MHKCTLRVHCEQFVIVGQIVFGLLSSLKKEAEGVGISNRAIILLHTGRGKKKKLIAADSAASFLIGVRWSMLICSEIKSLMELPESPSVRKITRQPINKAQRTRL